MADSKISDLSANGTLDGTELVELVQSGSNVKALLSAIKTYIVNGYLTAASIRVDAATFATIPVLTTSCFVFVAADETNDNLPTVYFFDGSELQWVPSVGV